MSAIFGLVYLDGRKVPDESLQAMSRALSQWGVNGGRVWRMESAGLGHVPRCSTPAPRNELMPSQDAVPGTMLAATARLDNRDELCAALGVAACDRASTTDGQLIAGAFQRWGEDCPRHLLGDWSFAAWNRRQRLFIARDQLGNTGLFYYYRPPLFAFASAPQALLALPDVPALLNEQQLARYLTIFRGAPSQTFWQGIHLLLPGHTLSVTSAGIQAATYWRLEAAPAVRLGSDREYLDGFLECCRRAVRTRLGAVQPVGATLSSGLDSGSVTALAAEELQQKGETLVALTSVPLYPAESFAFAAQSDEWPLAHAVAEHFGNIEHVPVRAESISPIAALHRCLALFHRPLHAAVNLFWLFALLDEAKRRSLKVLLTGQLGNGGISWSGGRDRIFYHFARGDWDTGRRELSAWRARHGCSWTKTIRHHLVRPLFMPLWSRRHRALHPQDPPWAEYAAIHPDFARRLKLREAMRSSGHDPSFGKPIAPSEERLITLSANGTAAGPIWQAFGAAFGLAVLDPTADVRLLEFCMGVPDELHSWGGGDRMLVRRAMEGILPPEVQWNTQRGRQAADVALRLLAHRTEVNAELDRLQATPAAREYLDLNAMQLAWQTLQASHAARAAAPSTTLLLRGIMAGIFLAALDCGSLGLRKEPLRTAAAPQTDIEADREVQSEALSRGAGGCLFP